MTLWEVLTETELGGVVRIGVGIRVAVIIIAIVVVLLLVFVVSIGFALVVLGHAAVPVCVGLGAVAAELGAVSVLVEGLVAQLGFEDEGVLDEFVAGVAVAAVVLELALPLALIAHRGPLTPERVRGQEGSAAALLAVVLVEFDGVARVRLVLDAEAEDLLEVGVFLVAECVWNIHLVFGHCGHELLRGALGAGVLGHDRAERTQVGLLLLFELLVQGQHKHLLLKISRVLALHGVVCVARALLELGLRNLLLVPGYLLLELLVLFVFESMFFFRVLKVVIIIEIV
eukprot:CAMPEP_0116904370 /NCGR_PEP_ID=MMETSP0467-20121206/11382_1 /TAXON_ID=283647 /ORGANISM="Mesodinium pulex, Strain SPMC105" /LENGTH=285 /DNA_ID=CAMNT_0004579009 /DNA_START=405 /DNA_END=1258 /DNA_ORIENTATION=+